MDIYGPYRRLSIRYEITSLNQIIIIVLWHYEGLMIFNRLSIIVIMRTLS